MLEPWSLKQARFRKQLAFWLFQRRCLRDAACIRATSGLEAASIRQTGCTKPIALVPNGVVLPEDLPRRPPVHLAQVRRALFLSRLHPKKGLLNLVEAWNRVRPAGWQLWIVGPDESGHRAVVERAVRACGLEQTILFQTEVWGEGRMKLYLDSDLFVLPSFSENFGLAIAEALSCGVPIITTRATPWEQVEKEDCGWWIDIGVEPLVQALTEAVSLPPKELERMGRRGRRLIEVKYRWESIGRKMGEVYEWMLGFRDKPECVSRTYAVQDGLTTD
jgi:glycosyltransferase involved in cell wall biosynthesis